jgi:hypothetical protein
MFINVKVGKIMQIQYKQDWLGTRERFSQWWAHKSTGRPVISLWTERVKPLQNTIVVEKFADDTERYLDVGKVVSRQLEAFSNLEPLAEAFPSVSLNLGAGSVAIYVGCEPTFRAESVWFDHFLTGYNLDGTVVFDENNPWFRKHIEMYQQGKKLIQGTDALLDIPDLVENLDIVSAMRGPQDMCYDLYDYPNEVKAAVWKLNGIYERCFDAFNNFCRDDTGGNAFTAFRIWGPGKTAKVQCDAAAMLSPGQFRDFVQEPLRAQCRWLTNSLFHLDGPECICHIPALMEIEELNALQWTPGDGKPMAGEDCWDMIYKQLKDAGKGLWVSLEGYEPDVAIVKADRLVKKFGAKDFYFLMPYMERSDAEALLSKADREWKA